MILYVFQLMEKEQDQEFDVFVTQTICVDLKFSTFAVG